MRRGTFEVLLAAYVTIAAGCEPSPGGVQGPESEENEAVLVRLALEKALVDREIPDYGLLAQRKPFVLASEHLE